MKNHHLFRKAFWALTLSAIVFCGGCQREKPEIVIENNSPDGIIDKQTCTQALTEYELVSGNYYVLHDKKYYPLATPLVSYEDAIEEGDASNCNRLNFFSIENENEIPTLFLGQEDKLIYYSEISLLDYILWERLSDFGYTIGLYGIQTMTNGRSYIRTDEDSYGVLPISEMYSLYGYGVNNILLDKLGGVQVTEDFLDRTMIKGLKKAGEYDAELYVGTHYQHFLTTANIHAFCGMENFASVNYETKQERIFEIEIPSYFVDGYYIVNGSGMLRLVLGDSYSEESDFNVPILVWAQDLMEDGPEKDALIAKNGINKPMYSEFPALNYFSTTVEGAVGYNEAAKELENAEQAEKDQLAMDIKDAIMQARVDKKTVQFLKGKDCKITIHSAERTGDCYVEFNRKRYNFERDFENQRYVLEIPGNGEVGLLVITGLFSDYEIDYENSQEVVGQ